MSERYVAAELGSGATVHGELVVSTGLSHVLSVEGRIVDLAEVEVVALRDAPRPDAEPDPGGPLRLTASALDPQAPGPSLRALLAGRCRVEACPRDPSEPPAPPLTAYAILDGARVEGLVPALAERGVSQPVCLYGGALSDEDAALAPYLVPLSGNDALSEWLGADGWSDHWGIVLLSPAGPEVVAAHLRSFLSVSDPSGQPLGFRFYDPRVLRPLLPLLDAHQVACLFGALSAELGDDAVLHCPRCGAAPASGVLGCVTCRTPFAGSPSAPLLISSIVLAGEAPGAVLHAQPWPAVAPEEDAAAAPPRRAVEAEQRGALLLEVSQEQLDALSADYERRQFRSWLVEHVRRVFPAKAAKLEGPALDARVADGQRRAEGYGLSEPDHVARFVDVMFLWHPEFDRHAQGPFAPVLADAELEPAQKAEQLWEVAKAVTAEALARRGGAS